MSFRTRLKQFFADERGASIPEVMVSVMMSAVTMTAIIGAITVLTTLHQQVGGSTTAVLASQTLDTRWRTDVRLATEVTPLTATEVRFSKPGSCSIWRINGGGDADKTITVNTIAVEPGATCVPLSSTAATVLANAGASASFVYKNSVGRSLTVVDGQLVVDTLTPMPAGTDPAAWESTDIAIATITALALPESPWELPIQISQRTNTPDASTAIDGIEVAPGPKTLIGAP